MYINGCIAYFNIGFNSDQFFSITIFNIVKYKGTLPFSKILIF